MKSTRVTFSAMSLDGHDAVSYFTESRAIKGEKQFSFESKEAIWLFSSDANRQRFIASPDAYAPQYGGYCSNQTSLGYLSDVDGQVWRIIDKRLYLFSHDAGRVRWASETDQRISDANRHWRLYLSQ